MYSAGFRFLIIGLESTSQRILELMNKGIDAEHAKKAVNWCLRAGIICQINLISNFPGCSYDVYREQAEYFESLAGKFKNFYLAILPFFVAYRSDIYDQPSDYFIRDLKPKCFLKIGGKEILNFNNIEFNYMLQENEENLSRLQELDKELMKINANHLLTFSREEKILFKRYTSQRKDLPAPEIGRIDPFMPSLFEMLEP